MYRIFLAKFTIVLVVTKAPTLKTDPVLSQPNSIHVLINSVSEAGGTPNKWSAVESNPDSPIKIFKSQAISFCIEFLYASVTLHE
jgi:hypothetical protein